MRNLPVNIPRCRFQKTRGRILPPAENHVLENLSQLGRNLLIHYRRRRIDDCHIHPRGNCVVKEDGVHSLADVIVPPERKRKIAQSAAYLRARQIFVNPFRGPDEVKCVGIVLPHPCSHCKHIRVEYDVPGIETGLFHKKTVGTGTYFYPPFESVRLTFFIKGHHHKGCAQFPYPHSPFQEHLLAFFQREGVHHGLALKAFQSSFYHFKAGRIHHHRHP